MIDTLAAKDGARFIDLLLDVLPCLTVVVLSDAVKFLVDAGREQDCARRFSDAMTDRHISPEMLCWLARNLPLMRKWRVLSDADLVRRILATLEAPPKGPHAKTLAQLVDLFEQESWLKELMSPISSEARADIIWRLRNFLSWPEVERNSVVARIIRIFPECKSMLATHVANENAAAEPPTRGRFTSWRTLAERLKLLEKIINVDIPKNAQDIAHARSYGDLSENHEFKAAKEQQSILSNTRDKLTAELREVRGTGFEDFPTDKADMGTRVIIKRDDHESRQFFILGEWDSDEHKRIVSCASGLALALAGHAAGETVEIPDADGRVPCKIIEVTKLPAEILDWAQGERKQAQAVNLTAPVK